MMMSYPNSDADFFMLQVKRVEFATECKSAWPWLCNLAVAPTDGYLICISALSRSNYNTLFSQRDSDYLIIKQLIPEVDQDILFEELLEHTCKILKDRLDNTKG